MNKKVNTAVCVTFVAFLALFAVAFWILPDKPFSEDENRTLRTLPELSFSDWLDGSLSASFTEYCSDQFPLRKQFVGMRSVYDLALGRGESGGVLYGEDGQLAVRLFDAWLSRTARAKDTDYASEAHIDAGLQGVMNLKNTLDESGVPLVVLLAPRSIDVAASAFSYPSDLSDKLNERVTSTLTNGGVHAVDLLGTMRERYDAGEYVYYRTDHHWTTKGAYIAYTAVLDALSQAADESGCTAASPGSPVPADAYAVRSIPAFCGTTWSRSGMYFVAPDTLEIWEADSDSCYTVQDESGETVLTGFIDESYLSRKDKYGAFLSGTNRLLAVTQTAPDPLSPSDQPGTSPADSTVDSDDPAGKTASRPRLLIARDSFASSLIPFLARHYDLVVVNLTSGPMGYTNLSDIATAYNCDGVLIVYNLENLITSDALQNIR